jgi:PAS domain S-box-containing protein
VGKAKKDNHTIEEIIKENEELRARLDEAEQTLEAIRSGNVDALVVTSPHGEQIFSLTGAEQVYRVIIEAMNEGSLTMDLGGYILFCNQRFCEMVKTPMEAIIGKRFTHFSAPNQQSAIRALVADAQAGPVRRNLVLQAGDTTSLSVLLSANLLVATKPPCICMVISDLTALEDSANSIKLLREQQEALQAANKELESFSYSVSHDLRTPLRAIDGYSRMILRKHADSFDDDSRTKFNVIRDNTRMMGQLIDDLLALSRLGKTPMSFAQINPVELIKEVWKELTAINPERRMTLKITSLPPCMGDQGLIKQVFANLLANAVKFTKTREEALIEVGGDVKGSESLYYIRDNGVGFDMEYHDKMFGVFQRLHSDEEFEGTGIGLALVQRIVNRHSGKIRAEGEVDKGATFYLTLPAYNRTEP